MIKESRLLSAPSESYLPSYESSISSIDDRTYTSRELVKVCQNGPTITTKAGTTVQHKYENYCVYIIHKQNMDTIGMRHIQ